MSTIAKGEITLSPVNDAYTVLITPASCTITADFDGSNPHLDNAKGTITVKRGTLEVPFKITGIAKSSDTITVLYSDEQATTMPFTITQVGNTILNGYVDFNLKTDDGFNYTTQIRFSFSIVRESTMLDWIQDWEGSKTKIGGTYIMTPKLFVGKKEDVIAEVNGVPTWNVGALTGVYIGPDLLSSGTSSVGIYGYLKDAEIFHINADGGYIGGWTFNAAGLQSANGVVHILSEGTIYAQNPNSTTPYWGIYADGHAIFANGNVKFQADGSAEFAGMITSKSGTIGGWHITTNQLYSNRFIIDSKDGFLGINATKLQVLNSTTNDLIFPDTPDGGLKLWYTAINDFGMAAWSSGKKVFQLGSINQIAGWNFNHQAIWSGGSVPALTQGAYTDSVDSLTVASNGIRSYKWYVDSNGTAAFVGGLVKFNTGNAEMFGWLMRQGRFSAKHAALISEEQNAGLYVSVADISEISGSSLRNTISNNGGIYIYSDGANSIMRAYDTNGNLGFYLSTSGYNTIGKWSFNHESIYTGSQNIDDHGFTRDANAIILGINGLIGNMWKLLADGSGAVAGGNISWTKEGKVTFSSQVTLSWSSITNGPNLTKIDANGIYTGTISADKITVGNITTDWIKNGDKWGLLIDGSGYLASKNILWDKDGNINVKGSFSQDIHYAYKCDATILSRTETDVEDSIELKLNHQLYIATNVYDIVDKPDYNDPTYEWPFELDYLHYYTVRLPLDPKFIGKEVKIYDCNYGPFSRQPMGWCTTTIKVENDVEFSTKISYEASFSKENLWKSITIRGGYASFVCIPSRYGTKGCSWICVDFYGALCEGVDAKGETHLNLLS